MSAVKVNIRALHAHPNPADRRYCDSDCAPVLVLCPLPSAMRFRIDGVKVDCTVSGTTWEETSLQDIEFPEHGPEARDARLEELARERWALVVNLMTGYLTATGPEKELVELRNAVFAALLVMARAEAVYVDGIGTVNTMLHSGPKVRHRFGSSVTAPDSIAARVLEDFMHHLRDLVEVLP